MTTQEVTTDAKPSEDVFEEDLEIDEINPRSRLRIRSRKVVLSVGGGEADARARARPSNTNQMIEQVDGVNESDNNDSIEEVEKKDDENFESTLTFDLTISACCHFS